MLMLCADDVYLVNSVKLMTHADQIFKSHCFLKLASFSPVQTIEQCRRYVEVSLIAEEDLKFEWIEDQELKA